MVYLGEINWLKRCNKCRPHDVSIYWLFRWLPRLSLAVVPEHRWTVSARCEYRSLLTCGMTLAHQSCKRFDSSCVLPQWTAMRVIRSGSLQEYGHWFCGPILLEDSEAIIECISSVRCAVRYAICGGGRSSTWAVSVLFLVLCESECRWLMAKHHHHRSIGLARQRRARLYVPRRYFISKVIGEKSRYGPRYHTYVRVHLWHEADRYSVQNRWFLVELFPV